MPETLDAWIDRQYRVSAEAMLESVSPVTIIKTRPGFGQTIAPKPGSIVASPVLASYDPDPDYFFHWFRDSAIVVDAIRLLHEEGTLGPEAVAHFSDFIGFSLSLSRLSGRPLADDPSWRKRTKADFEQFLRPEAELAAVTPDEVIAETRVNPDGTLDISRWARPQHDGPALRILIVLRWLASKARLSAETRAAAGRLLDGDIDFILRHGDGPSYDIWEEELGQHYYTLRTQMAALAAAEAWLAGRDDERAEACRRRVSELRPGLDAFWDEGAGFYRSRLAGAPNKLLDISVIFAAVHSGDDGPLDSVHDVRMLATLEKLAALFAGEYEINRDRPRERGPALGRYSGDVYYSGGAYYFSTLAAAEFYYRFAQASAGDVARTYLERGDAYLETVRAFTPETGELSEQFDHRTGGQTSAKKLAWSYAALITAVKARRSLIARRRP